MNGIHAVNGVSSDPETETIVLTLDGECDAWLAPSMDESGDLSDMEICLAAAGS